MTVKIRPFSDLHNDVSPYHIPEMPDDHETVLVLAGDIDEIKTVARYTDFIVQVSKRFKSVVWIFGNHDHWKSSIIRAPEKARELIKNNNLTNVHFLHNESVVIDGVAFVGGTMWSDVENRVTQSIVESKLNDYKKIRHGTKSQPWGRKLKASDINYEHYLAKKFFEEEAQKQKELGNKVVVVSHHAPSKMSLCLKYINDDTNDAYYAKMEDLMESGFVDLWIHGHIHEAKDYLVPVSGTRVVCNPRGYHDFDKNKHEDTKFNPGLVIEL